MERRQLRTARVRKGWSLEKAAEHIGVGRNTLWRWEFGQANPYPYNVHRLCTVYGMTAGELGLQANQPEEDVQPHHADLVRPPDQDMDACIDILHDSMQHDLELRLQCLIYDWLHRKKPAWSLAKLQEKLSEELESYDQMHDQNYLNHTAVDPARRDVLRRLALLPLQALGLGVLGTSLSWTSEDTLTHCATGITACGYLSRGRHEDMTLAFSVLSAYLPSLKAIIKESSLHRKEAASLLSQCLQLKAILANHLENPRQSTGYAEQAVSYARESGNGALLVMALRQLSSSYFYNCRRDKALHTAEEAQYLIEQVQGSPLSPLLQSWVYGGLARYQAQNGGEQQAVLTSLGKADEAFSLPPAKKDVPGYLDHGEANHMFLKGVAYYFRGQQKEAIDAFSQVIDLDDEHFAAKLPMSRRVYIEAINYTTLASLKLSRESKDLERSVKLWTAGIQGAAALRSEQRFNEALTAYEIMEALWPSEKRIAELRDFTRHW